VGGSSGDLYFSDEGPIWYGWRGDMKEGPKTGSSMRIYDVGFLDGDDLDWGIDGAMTEK